MNIPCNILRKILWSQYNKTIADIKATTPIVKQTSYISICNIVARFTDVILTLIPIIKYTDALKFLQTNRLLPAQHP